MEEKLFDRDWRFIVEAIHRLNSIEDLEQFERETLESLMVLIPCDQGTFFLYEDDSDYKLKIKGSAVVAGVPALYLEDFQNGGYEEEPYFRGMDELGVRLRVFRDSEILPEDYRVQTKLYKEIYAKQGIHYSLRMFSVSNGKTVGNISLFNSREHGEFSRKSKEILTILEPHITLKLNNLRNKLSAEGGKKSEGTTTDFNSLLTEEAMKDKIHKLNLTNREVELLGLLLKGVSDTEIADQLFIASSTFKKHLYNIYRKLNVNNRTQLYRRIRTIYEESS